jgi:hypothetical protein
VPPRLSSCLKAGGGSTGLLEPSSDSLLAQSAGQTGTGAGNGAESLPLLCIEYWPPEPVTPVSVPVSELTGDSRCEHYDCCYSPSKPIVPLHPYCNL